MPVWGGDTSYVGSLFIYPPKINQPPVFIPFIEVVHIGIIPNVEDQMFIIGFPQTYDAEGTDVTLKIISPLPSFMTFDR